MILVTGATGNVGRHAVSGLLRAGAKVRALTRTPGTARFPDGVAVAGGDLADPGSLEDALSGVDAVFLVWPTVSADHAAPATIDLIAEHARRIVYLSARGVPEDSRPDPGPIIGSHAAMEHRIERSGLEYTFLRPGGFATNTLMWAPQIRGTGVVRSFYGAAARPLIHERDIAAVGVAALTGDGHAGARYVLTGPQVLTQAEQVKVIGEAIGRALRWEELPPETARREMLEQGWAPSFADQILEAHAKMVTAPETVTCTVEEVTGRPATGFGEWAADHAADFR